MLNQDRVTDLFVKYLCQGDFQNLCRECYHPEIKVFSSGRLFAIGRTEAFEKQNAFSKHISKFDISLTYRYDSVNHAELRFQYQFVTDVGETSVFNGLHLLRYKDGKIAREDFLRE